ncbi:MAG: CPBP family intramembrane metalloprotease [Anaerolineales bacterium]|nr:CPBP family intramembrane metalloprotease [Anaerolineales bacterium]
MLRRSLFEQVEKQPGNPRLWILLGWSADDAHSAATYFRRALAIDPEHPVARDGLKWAQAEIGPGEAPPRDPRETPGADQTGGNQSDPAALAAAVNEVQAASKPLTHSQDLAPTALRAANTIPGSRSKARGFRWRTLSQFYQIPFLRNLSIAILYLFLISAAEAVTVLVNPILGIIFHAGIMIALLVQGSILQRGPFRRYLVMLSLAPLIRVLSLSLPLGMFDFPVMYRYMIVGVPILLAAFFAARSVGLTANRLYLTWKRWPLQLLFSLVGFVLGFVEYIILRPNALVPSGSWFDIAMGIFILFIFTGFLEEFIFRSLLQVTGIQLLGGLAIWVISILFGILHIGYYSAFDVIFASLVGLFFGYYALKTRSILGVSLAHGITNITLYILMPLVLH